MLEGQRLDRLERTLSLVFTLSFSHAHLLPPGNCDPSRGSSKGCELRGILLELHCYQCVYNKKTKVVCTTNWTRDDIRRGQIDDKGATTFVKVYRHERKKSDEEDCVFQRKKVIVTCGGVDID